MGINEKMIREIAGQLGLSGSKAVSSADIQRLENKSDRELEAEILRMKERLAASNVPVSRQVAMLKAMMPMMDANQRGRLQQIIRVIERGNR